MVSTSGSSGIAGYVRVTRGFFLPRRTQRLQRIGGKGKGEEDADSVKYLG